jgi:hypothetical protein
VCGAKPLPPDLILPKEAIERGAWLPSQSRGRHRRCRSRAFPAAHDASGSSSVQVVRPRHCVAPGAPPGPSPHPPAAQQLPGTAPKSQCQTPLASSSVFIESAFHEEPAHHFVLVECGDGSADVYLERDNMMANHITGEDPWELLVKGGRAAGRVILPVGCPTCVAEAQRNHLPAGLDDDVALLATGGRAPRDPVGPTGRFDRAS